MTATELARLCEAEREAYATAERARSSGNMRDVIYAGGYWDDAARAFLAAARTEVPSLLRRVEAMEKALRLAMTAAAFAADIDRRWLPTHAAIEAALALES